MSQIIQLRSDSAANWTLQNPILAVAEAGYETGTGNMKIGDGATHWRDLPYKVFNIKGDKGDTGTGLSRTLSTTINMGSEQQYVEKIISDTAILSTSVIFIQVVDDEYLLQKVSCKTVSITQGVGYTIGAIAPDRASGIMNINILIF